MAQIKLDEAAKKLAETNQISPEELARHIKPSGPDGTYTVKDVATFISKVAQGEIDRGNKPPAGEPELKLTEADRERLKLAARQFGIEEVEVPVADVFTPPEALTPTPDELAEFYAWLREPEVSLATVAPPPEKEVMEEVELLLEGAPAKEEAPEAPPTPKPAAPPAKERPAPTKPAPTPPPTPPAPGKAAPKAPKPERKPAPPSKQPPAPSKKPTPTPAPPTEARPTAPSAPKEAPKRPAPTPAPEARPSVPVLVYSTLGIHRVSHAAKLTYGESPDLPALILYLLTQAALRSGVPGDLWVRVDGMPEDQGWPLAAATLEQLSAWFERKDHPGGKVPNDAVVVLLTSGDKVPDEVKPGELWVTPKALAFALPEAWGKAEARSRFVELMAALMEEPVLAFL